jgi:hypothetical protein
MAIPQKRAIVLTGLLLISSKIQKSDMQIVIGAMYIKNVNSIKAFLLICWNVSVSIKLSGGIDGF